MTREEKIAKIDDLCLATVCYSCNFVFICNKIHDLDELPDEVLDAMIQNGNQLGNKPLFLHKEEEEHFL